MSHVYFLPVCGKVWRVKIEVVFTGTGQEAISSRAIFPQMCKATAPPSGRLNKLPRPGSKRPLGPGHPVPAPQVWVPLGRQEGLLGSESPDLLLLTEPSG